MRLPFDCFYSVLLGLAEQLLISFTILLLPFFLLLFIERKKPGAIPKNLSLGKPDVVSGLKLFGLVFIILFLESALLYSIGLLDTEKVQQIIVKQPALSLLLAVTVSPLGEELFFRGYLQKKTGIALASVLFALLHYGYGSVSEIAAAFTFSLIAGYWVKKEKNVTPCIFAHALFNIMSIYVALNYV